MRAKTACVVQSQKFDATIGFVIVLNSIVIGVEQSHRINGRHVGVLDLCEHIFLVIYLGELLLRFFVLGISALKDHWVKFDFFLVMTSAITQWIMQPIFAQHKKNDLAFVSVMRTARLARLARSFRLLVKFRQLWMLVRGLLFSAKMVVYTLITLCIILYVFAAVGVEFIRLDYGYVSGSGNFSLEYRVDVEKYFPSLPLTMLTLLQFVCMDSIGSIYRPLIQENPSLAVYFVAIILIVAVVFMNIVTAVLVNGALEQAAEDKEMQRSEQEKKKKKLMKQLYDMFARLDEDESGMVDRDELLNATEEDKYLLNEFMELKDPLEVFDQLDIDGDGSLEIDEFCEGLFECAMSNTPIELKRIDKRIDAMRKHQSHIEVELQTMTDHVMKLTSSVQESLQCKNHKSAEGEEQIATKEPKAVRDFLSSVIHHAFGQTESAISVNQTPERQNTSCVPDVDDTPPWASHVETELRELVKCVHSLDINFQKSISSQKMLSDTPMQPTAVRAGRSSMADFFSFAECRTRGTVDTPGALRPSGAFKTPHGTVFEECR